MAENVQDLTEGLKSALADLGLGDIIGKDRQGEAAADPVNVDYAATFGTPAGRRVLDHMVSRFISRGFYTVGASADVAVYDAGCRDVLKEILWRIEQAKE